LWRGLVPEPSLFLVIVGTRYEGFGLRSRVFRDRGGLHRYLRRGRGEEKERERDGRQ